MGVSPTGSDGPKAGGRARLYGTAPPVAATGPHVINGAVRRASHSRSAGAASSSMNTTMSPAAAAMPTFLARLTFGSGHSTMRARSASAVTERRRDSDARPSTTISSNGSDCRSSAVTSHSNDSTRSPCVQTMTETRPIGDESAPMISGRVCSCG